MASSETNARKALFELFPEEREGFDLSTEEEFDAEHAEKIWERIKPRMEEFFEDISIEIGEQIETVHELIDEQEPVDLEPIVKRLDSLEKAHTSLKGLSSVLEKTRSDFKKEIDDSAKVSRTLARQAIANYNDVAGRFSPLSKEIQRAHTRIDKLPDAYDDSTVWDELIELRKLLLKTQQGGGNARMNVWVNGNSSVLSRYSDINLKAGSNVTLSYVNNDTQKTTDITIASSGGGGGGTGYQSVLSGVVNGVNNVFTWNTAPNVIVVDQTKSMQAVSSDGTTNWTGTTTTTLTVAPTFDIYGAA